MARALLNAKTRMLKFLLVFIVLPLLVVGGTCGSCAYGVYSLASDGTDVRMSHLQDSSTPDRWNEPLIPAPRRDNSPAATYHCNLANIVGQCSEQRIVESTDAARKMCENLDGTWGTGRCPTDGAVAYCENQLEERTVYFPGVLVGYSVRNARRKCQQERAHGRFQVLARRPST